MKDFKTIDEQLALLRSRGLIIPNEEKARLYLLTNNYYSVYTSIILDSSTFVKYI